MADKYYEKAEGNLFIDLADDPEMQADLVRFFSGKRYGMTKEELLATTPQQLADDFVAHMRYQDVNEVTVFRDINFVNRAKKNGDEDSLNAFGRLMMAYDASEGGGTGFWEGAWDYGTGALMSPTTLLVLGSRGGASQAKVVGQGATQGGKMMLRKYLMDTFAKEAAGRIVLNEAGVTAAKQSVKGAVVKGALTGMAIEGAMGAGHAYGQEVVRREAIDGYEVNTANVATAGLVSAAGGMILGGLARKQSASKQHEIIDYLAKQGVELKASDISAVKTANATLSKVADESPEYKGLVKRTEELISIMKARESGSKKAFKEALDTSDIELGRSIADKAFKSSEDTAINSRISVNTVKKVAAASIEIADKLKFSFADDVRVTQRVADALDSGEITSDFLTDLMGRYGLSKNDFKLVFLADLSDAGRKLNQASQVAKAADKAGFKKNIDTFVNNIDSFVQRGIVSADDDGLAKMANTVKAIADGKAFVQTLREIDAARIGLMVAQPATTARNVISSIGRLGVDASDRMFLNLLERRNLFDGVLTTIRGITFDHEEAVALKLLTEVESDSKFAKIFHSYARLENDIGSNSKITKAVNLLNTLNTITDTQFKQAVFYSSINRQLTSADAALNLPKTVKEMLEKGVTLDSLPENILEKARREALSFSYQRGYEDAAEWSGKAARGLINANIKYPFLVSAVAGVPFPRYLTNQLEFIHKYGPTGMIENFYRLARGTGTNDALESTTEAFAKSMTGSLLMASAFALRMQFGSEVKYNEVLNEADEVVQIGGAAGPYQGFLFIADMLARAARGEEIVPKMSVTAKEATEILTGLNTFGFNGSTITSLIDAFENGSDTEILQRWAADVIATLTLPASTFKDIQAQFNADAMTNPYTRNWDPESGVMGSVFAQRAIRFLPDYGWVQLASSFNGKYDVPLYSGFNEEPVMRVNPILNQLVGMPISPKRNALQNELISLQIPEYTILGSRKIKNPNTDIAVRMRLSKTLPKEFEDWKANETFFGGLTYDQLPTDQKKVELKAFLSLKINQAEDIVEDSWKSFAATKPKSAAGWIINNYHIKSQEYNTVLGSMDRVAKYITGRDISADEYIEEGEFFVDKLQRRQELLQTAEIMAQADRASRQ